MRYFDVVKAEPSGTYTAPVFELSVPLVKIKFHYKYMYVLHHYYTVHGLCNPVITRCKTSL